MLQGLHHIKRGNHKTVPSHGEFCYFHQWQFITEYSYVHSVSI